VAELEKGFEEVRRNSPEERFRRDAVLHAATVAAIATYGEPDKNEPLAGALNRMREKIDDFVPLSKQASGRNLDLLRIFYPIFILNRERDVESQLQEILCNEPPWLLKFTGIHWDALILGFTIPSLLRSPPLGRDARQDRNRWPATPLFTIEAGGPCSEPEESVSLVVERLRTEYRLQGYRQSEGAEKRRGKLKDDDFDGRETYWGSWPILSFPPLKIRS
jgi:hypothetical protein